MKQPPILNRVGVRPNLFTHAVALVVFACDKKFARRFEVLGLGGNGSAKRHRENRARQHEPLERIPDKTHIQLLNLASGRRKHAVHSNACLGWWNETGQFQLVVQCERMVTGLASGCCRLHSKRNGRFAKRLRPEPASLDFALVMLVRASVHAQSCKPGSSLKRLTKASSWRASTAHREPFRAAIAQCVCVSSTNLSGFAVAC